MAKIKHIALSTRVDHPAVGGFFRPQ